MKQLGTLNQPARTLCQPEWSAEPLPLVVFPRRGAGDSGDWMAALRSCIERYLPRVGSILFRGFPVRSAEEFACFAAAFGASRTRDPGDAGTGRLWIGCTNAAEANADTLIADTRELRGVPWTACASRVEWEPGDVLLLDRAITCVKIPEAQWRTLHFAVSASGLSPPS
jgi:hypothetical protein